MPLEMRLEALGQSRRLLLEAAQELGRLSVLLDELAHGIEVAAGERMFELSDAAIMVPLRTADGNPQEPAPSGA